MKKFLRLTGWMLLVVVFTGVLLFWLHRPSLKVVATWKQPSDIKYDGLGPYYLSVVEDDIDWRAFPLFVQRSYFIYAGRDSGTPSYGHMIDFSFDPMEDLPAFRAKRRSSGRQGVFD